MIRKFLIIAFVFISVNNFAQVVTEDTKRKFTFGLDVFTDIWQDKPSTIEPRTINQGANVFGTYNFIVGESNFSFSPGLGLSMHNMYSDSWLKVNSDSTWFEPIPDSINFDRSKLNITYIDIPFELRFKNKSEFRVAVGFKFGFLLRGHTKIKGDDFISGTTDNVIIKKKKVSFLEKNRYGFTGRIGYKWLNVWGYYQLSTLFETDRGPQIYPISIGITVIPF